MWQPRSGWRLWIWVTIGLFVILWLYLVLQATVFSQEVVPEKPVTLPAYSVADFQEPSFRIQTEIGGRSQVLLYRLDDPTDTMIATVSALRLVDIFANQTALGRCCGKRALSVGRKQPRNKLFYHNPRIACAAYTAYILRGCGRKGGSYSASVQYAQLRKRGAKIVAARISTRYGPYFSYLKPGDALFFHKPGGRIGHVEFYVGGGKTSGTSSSAGRVAIRKVGNRGFSLMSVLRI